MLSLYLKYATIVVALFTVIGGLLFGITIYVIGKICFYILLMSYYYTAVKKANWLLFIGLFAAFIGKFCFDSNFNEYYIVVLLCYAECYLSGIILMFPYLRVSNIKIKGIDFLFTIISVFIFGYLVITTFSLSTDQLNEYFFFGILSFTFTLFVASCFYIAAFHNHPKRIYLFTAGVANLLSGIGAMIYIFYVNSEYFMFVVNTLEIISLFSFVYFMVCASENGTVKKQYL